MSTEEDAKLRRVIKDALKDTIKQKEQVKDANPVSAATGEAAATYCRLVGSMLSEMLLDDHELIYATAFADIIKATAGISMYVEMCASDKLRSSDTLLQLNEAKRMLDNALRKEALEQVKRKLEREG